MLGMLMGMCALVARALNSGPSGDWDTNSVKEMFKLVTGRYRVIPLPRALRTLHPRAIGLLPSSIQFSKMPHKERLDMTNEALTFLGNEMAPWLVDTPEWPQIAQITGQMESAA